MKKYVNIYNKKYDDFVVHCLLKLLTNTNNIKYIRMIPRYYMYYILFTPRNFIWRRINKERSIFSKVDEMRITLLLFIYLCRMSTILNSNYLSVKLS